MKVKMKALKDSSKVTDEESLGPRSSLFWFRLFSLPLIMQGSSMFSVAQIQALCQIIKMVAKRMKGERRSATRLG